MEILHTVGLIDQPNGNIKNNTLSSKEPEDCDFITAYSDMIDVDLLEPSSFEDDSNNEDDSSNEDNLDEPVMSHFTTDVQISNPVIPDDITMKSVTVEENTVVEEALPQLSDNDTHVLSQQTDNLLPVDENILTSQNGDTVPSAPTQSVLPEITIPVASSQLPVVSHGDMIRPVQLPNKLKDIRNFIINQNQQTESRNPFEISLNESQAVSRSSPFQQQSLPSLSHPSQSQLQARHQVHQALQNPISLQLLQQQQHRTHPLPQQQYHVTPPSQQHVVGNIFKNKNPFVNQNPFPQQTIKKNPFINVTPVINHNPVAQCNPFHPQRNPFQEQCVLNCNPFTNRPTAQQAVHSSANISNPFLSSKPQQPLVSEVPKQDSRKESRRHKKKKTYDVVDNMSDSMKAAVPDGHKLISTAYGMYTIPDYSRMTEDELQRRRASFEFLFKDLNEKWMGVDKNNNIKMPTPDETVENIDIRYQQTVRYIKQKKGFSLPRLMMLVSWIGIEIIGKKMGLPTDGYFASQIELYDIYESKFIHMGQISVIGEDWPAWLQLVFTSVMHLVILVLFNKYMTGKRAKIINKVDAMRGLNNFLNGNTSMVVTDENGKTKMTADPISSAFGLDMGGLNVTNIVKGGISTFFGGNDDDDEDDEEEEEPKDRRSRRKARKKREKPAVKPSSAEVDRDELPEEV